MINITVHNSYNRAEMTRQKSFAYCVSGRDGSGLLRAAIGELSFGGTGGATVEDRSRSGRGNTSADA